MSRPHIDPPIYVESEGLATFPDGTIFFGPLVQHAAFPNATAMDPAVLLEVTSASSQEYDAELNPSLQEVVFVAHDARRVMVVRRSGDAWTSHEAGEHQVAMLASVGCELSVGEVYRDDTLGASRVPTPAGWPEKVVVPSSAAMREGWTFAWTTHEDLAREQAQTWDACSVEERVAAVEVIRQAAFALHGIVPGRLARVHRLSRVERSSVPDRGRTRARRTRAS